MFKENFAFKAEKPKRPERPNSREKINEQLNQILKKIAAQINEDLKSFTPDYRNFKQNIVEDDCSLNPRAFSKGREAGPYSKNDSPDKETSIKDDENFIKERLMDWSGLENPKVQNFYKEKYACKTLEDMLTQYQKNRESENGFLLEKALTVLLHRRLGSDFFVLRTSDYDDMANGVDNLIINKETGEVICAFDGLNEEFDNSRRNEKLHKVIKKSKAGGAKIKYGLKIEKQELQKQALHNLPIFYLSLNKNELNELLYNLNDDPQSPLKNQEENIMQKLFQSFEDQINLLLQENLPEKLQKNLVDFQQTIEILK